MCACIIEINLSAENQNIKTKRKKRYKKCSFKEIKLTITAVHLFHYIVFLTFLLLLLLLFYLCYLKDYNSTDNNYTISHKEHNKLVLSKMFLVNTQIDILTTVFISNIFFLFPFCKTCWQLLLYFSCCCCFKP